MGQLFSQLGIAPAALLWQTLNFLVVLVVLYWYVYKPLAVLVAERSRKIEQGLADAARAAGELARAEEMYQQRMSDAEGEAVGVMRKAEQDAQTQAQRIITKGEERDAAMLAEARTLAERVREEEMLRLESEAKDFVQAVLQKTVELDPKHIDNALIEQAAAMVRAHHHAHKTV
ncbi:MAG: hypothetical protein WC030_00015 [Candidatus Paceibacterota bacterium]